MYLSTCAKRRKISLLPRSLQSIAALSAQRNSKGETHRGKGKTRAAAAAKISAGAPERINARTGENSDIQTTSLYYTRLYTCARTYTQVAPRERGLPRIRRRWRAREKEKAAQRLLLIVSSSSGSSTSKNSGTLISCLRAPDHDAPAYIHCVYIPIPPPAGKVGCCCCSGGGPPAGLLASMLAALFRSEGV